MTSDSLSPSAKGFDMNEACLSTSEIKNYINFFILFYINAMKNLKNLRIVGLETEFIYELVFEIVSRIRLHKALCPRLKF